MFFTDRAKRKAKERFDEMIKCDTLQELDQKLRAKKAEFNATADKLSTSITETLTLAGQIVRKIEQAAIEGEALSDLVPPGTTTSSGQKSHH